MSDGTQGTLGDFEQGAEEDRPVADEAAAIAGNGGSDTDGTSVVDLDERQFPPVEETVEFVVTQVDYTIEGQGDEEFPVVHVFGRTDDNEPIHARVFDFKPYFYAPTDSVTDDELRQYGSITGWEEADEDGEPYESIRGERLTKIFGQTPRDVGQIRDDFDHYEADILFPNRLLIDKDITSGVCVPARELDDDSLKVHHEEIQPVEAHAEPRVNTFDIEVDDRQGFPEDGEETIVCLTSHDSYRDEYVVWLYESPDGIDGPEALAGYDPIREDFEADVRVFDEEEAMLEAFVDYIVDTDPDVLTGWNFDDFDAPYFLDRLEELQSYNHDYDLQIDRLSRVDEVWRSGWGGPDIKGRVVFDLLYAYKRTQFTELESYRLDAVGEQELGVGKERYTGDIGDLWEQDPEQLLEYNLRDVELCVELDREQDIIDFWDEVRTFVGCKLEDATTPGDAVDMYVLHKLHGEFALPSKGQQESEDYEGGAVFDPITGVRENVTVLDLKSLYPMCMVTTNASPETKVDPDTYDGDTYRAPNGTHFRKEPDGVIREMVDELLSEREEKKAERNSFDPDNPEYERFDRQQAAVKVIMNCFTPDTDVLTPAGVQNIRDLDVGDEVYSLDPETEEMEVKPVVETQSYPDYRGDLVDIETSKMDFRVTPNHRMLVRKNDKNGITEDGWKFKEAGDLYDYCNYEMPHDWDFQHRDRFGETIDIVQLAREYTETGITLSDGGTMAAAKYGTPNISRKVSTNDFLEFLAWYITEGSVYESKTSNYRINIAQEHTGRREKIETLVDQFVEYWYTDERSVSFSSRIWAELLTELCGSGSDSKRIPELVFEASESQKQQFLETLIQGDGDWQKNAWRFSTISQQLRDDILRLCTHLGLTASYNRDGAVWRIYCTEDAKNSFRMHRDGSESTAGNGVYCVTVKDNNTLIAGRNGKFQNVGNSLYGVLGWDRFRLYDKEMGAAVTATGREVIDYTDEVVANEGYEVVYGDTDSVMLQLGNVGPDDVEGDVEITDEMREKHPEMDDDELELIATTIQKGFELEETINASYDEFAMEQLNAEFHRFEIEFEKLYRRFFQAGKKKRYAGNIVWKEGKHVDDIDITGFEYQRSDIAPITKRVQKEVIDRIVRGEDAESIKQYVSDVIEDYQAGNVDYDDVGIPGGIGKKLDNYDTDTAQVRGAKYANLLLGTNFQSGSKPKRLYLDRVHSDFFQRIEEEEGLDPQRDPLYGEFRRDPDVICFEYADQIPEEFEIDWDKMLDKTLKGPIARILEAMDISWEEVKSGQEQTGLGSFM
ncbi:DNA polymerase domain-containing protein [Haloarcula sp. CGMCC 1.2071]|uniref:DNA polymerase domain-containing protein n=1 Tax=Haloarcula sp. CGMCC 1.2071 TaxID=3111454 RepID=UPI00300F0892